MGERTVSGSPGRLSFSPFIVLLSTTKYRNMSDVIINPINFTGNTNSLSFSDMSLSKRNEFSKGSWFQLVLQVILLLCGGIRYWLKRRAKQLPHHRKTRIF